MLTFVWFLTVALVPCDGKITSHQIASTFRCRSEVVCGLELQEIAGTVGRNGQNSTADVKRIQSLLNQVPSQCGGPSRSLTVDGLAGQRTIKAIQRFQQIQLGFKDGLVEPGKGTIDRLLEFEGFAEQERGDPKIAWGALVTAGFKNRLIEVADALDVEPDFLMAAMAFETAESFSPAIRNFAGSGATGLIQFMPATAKSLGTSTEDLARLSAVEQLDFVKKYFWPYRGRLKTIDDVYMAILWPRAIGKAADYVLFSREDGRSYELNAALDADRDGNVTKAEAAARVREKLEQGRAEPFAG